VCDGFHLKNRAPKGTGWGIRFFPLTPSLKVGEMAVAQEDGWRKIPITLINLDGTEEAVGCASEKAYFQG